LHSEVEQDLKSLEAVRIIGADHVFEVMRRGRTAPLHGAETVAVETAEVCLNVPGPGDDVMI